MKTEEAKKRGRGRPKGSTSGATTTPFPLKLCNDLVEYVRAQPNRNKFINDCIRQRKEGEAK